MSFWTDIGKRITGTDDYTSSIAEMNIAQAEYLKSLANQDVVDTQATLEQQKQSNTFLYVTVAGSLIAASAIAFIVMKRRRG